MVALCRAATPAMLSNIDPLENLDVSKLLCDNEGRPRWRTTVTFRCEPATDMVETRERKVGHELSTDAELDFILELVENIVLLIVTDSGQQWRLGSCLGSRFP